MYRDAIIGFVIMVASMLALAWHAFGVQVELQEARQEARQWRRIADAYATQAACEEAQRRIAAVYATPKPTSALRAEFELERAIEAQRKALASGQEPASGVFPSGLSDEP